MEKYIELSVTKHQTFKDRIIAILISFLPVLIGMYILVLVVFAKATTLLPLAILLEALMLFLSYKLYGLFNVDWEYTLVDDELRFAKIINKSKRREVLTVSIPKTEIIARVADEEHNRSLRSDAKRYTFISQTNKDFYFIKSFDSKGNRVCVFFEPDERMCDNFSVTARGKFFK